MRRHPNTVVLLLLLLAPGTAAAEEPASTRDLLHRMGTSLELGGTPTAADALAARETGADAIASFSGDEDPRVRLGLAWVLSKEKTPTPAVSTLARLLEDEEPVVRRHSAQGLRTHGGAAASAEEGLRTLAAKPDEERAVRKAAIGALHSIRMNRSVDAQGRKLIPAPACERPADDPDLPDERSAAAPTRALLDSLLEDPDPEIRSLAVRILGGLTQVGAVGFDHGEVVALLEKRREDPDRPVAQEAGYLLRQLRDQGACRPSPP